MKAVRIFQEYSEMTEPEPAISRGTPEEEYRLLVAERGLFMSRNTTGINRDEPEYL
jgi:hypothetical protein